MKKRFNKIRLCQIKLCDKNNDHWYCIFVANHISLLIHRGTSVFKLIARGGKNIFDSKCVTVTLVSVYHSACGRERDITLKT